MTSTAGPDGDNSAPGQPPLHRSVLLEESLSVLNPQPGQCAVDCTVGAGGHSAAILTRLAPGGWLIGLDADPGALTQARVNLTEPAQTAQVRLELLHRNFSNLTEVLQELQAPAPHAILADLGVSSMQFDRAERGFSFRFDAPLDMRMNPDLPQTAADLLRELSETELADLIYILGQERGSRRIARLIAQTREQEPIATTGQLEALVRRALRVRGHRRIHPATKTFQALRMAVNRELETLAELLRSAPECLAIGGALAIITFHSLEDREVKQQFKALAKTGRFQQIGTLLRPGAPERAANPRSRSAKLRALRRIA